MASYIDTILVDGERVIHRARRSMWSRTGLIVLGVLLLPLGIGVILIFWAWLSCKATELAITNKRIIAKSGIVRRATMEMRLDKIESITVEQGFWGRMLNFGSITIAGTGGDRTPIESITEPLAFQKYFMTATDVERK